jgi:hypothetical protein
VPSDLEQMPTLYNFLKDNGTLGSNSHTVLISHTADGIISTLTGVYPDRTGTGLSNSFNYYVPDGTAPFISTFGYWTNIIPDSAPLMVDEKGKIAPAPWVAYTRAGCDVGNVSVANTVLENNSSDVVNVFGAGSPEATEPPGPEDGRLRWHRHPLRAGLVLDLRRAGRQSEGRPAARRAGRLQRVPGALRAQIRRARDQWRQHCDDRSAGRAADRVPGLRRHVPQGHRGLCRKNARSRCAGRVRLHLRRA